MNSFKLNGRIGGIALKAISNGLGINFSEIYKTIKHLEPNCTIVTKDGCRYRLKLEYVGRTNF